MGKGSWQIKLNRLPFIFIVALLLACSSSDTTSDKTRTAGQGSGLGTGTGAGSGTGIGTGTGTEANSLKEKDSDKDSIPDKLDNCPYTSNKDQKDENKNKIGDDCECKNKHSECSDGFLCYKNRCQKTDQCKLAQDCPNGEKCDGGICINVQCITNQNCQNGKYCFEEKCRTKCDLKLGTFIANSQCNMGYCKEDFCFRSQCKDDDSCQNSNEICQNGRCINQVKCNSNPDCPTNSTCIKGICRQKNFCISDHNCDLKKSMICLKGFCEIAISCKENKDCGTNQLCLAGQCNEKTCRGNSDCSNGEYCDGASGQCLIRKIKTNVQQVLLSNNGGQIIKGESIKLIALGLDSKAKIIPGLKFKFTSSNPQVAKIDSNDYLIGANNKGITEIKATINSKTSNPISYNNPGPKSSGVYQVYVFDSQDGKGIKARIELGGKVLNSDADGRASFKSQSSVNYIIVESSGYESFAILGKIPSQISVPLRKYYGTEKAGGYKGKIDSSFFPSNPKGEAEIGLAGLSIPRDFANISSQNIFGEFFMLKIPSIAGSSPAELNLPGALTFKVNIPALNINIDQSEYHVLGSPRFRLSYAFGGKENLNTLIGLFQNLGGSQITEALVKVMPLLETFNHGLGHLVNITMQDRVYDSNDINSNGRTFERIPNYQSGPNIKTTQAQTFKFGLQLADLAPHLNHLGYKFFIFSGAYIKGAGFLPLGITTIKEDAKNKFPLKTIRMAPLYGGLEVAQYGIWVFSFRMNKNLASDNLFPEEGYGLIWNGKTMPTKTIKLASFSEKTPSTRVNLAKDTLTLDKINQNVSVYRLFKRAGKTALAVYIIPAAKQKEFKIPTSLIGSISMGGGESIFQSLWSNSKTNFNSLLEGKTLDLRDLNLWINRYSTGTYKIQ